MKLVVDIGNTRVKWSWARGLELQGESISIQDDMETVMAKSWRQQVAPENVLIASVGPDRVNRQIDAWLLENWGIKPEYFQSQAQTFTLRNGYHDPGQLGCDRWAALLGARSLSDGVLSVVDCGTAVTIDALSEQDYFPGGVILPGVTLTQDCLSDRTAGIQEDRSMLESVLGKTTAQCISSGSYVGLAGAIDRVLTEIQDRLGMGKIYITGGDAASLLALIKHENIIHDPDLVLRGLAYVLEKRG